MDLEELAPELFMTQAGLFYQWGELGFAARMFKERVVQEVRITEKPLIDALLQQMESMIFIGKGFFVSAPMLMTMRF